MPHTASHRTVFLHLLELSPTTNYTVSNQNRPCWQRLKVHCISNTTVNALLANYTSCSKIFWPSAKISWPIYAISNQNKLNIKLLLISYINKAFIVQCVTCVHCKQRWAKPWKSSQCVRISWLSAQIFTKPWKFTIVWPVLYSTQHSS